MDILLLFDKNNPNTAACSLFCVDVNLKLTYLRSRIMKEVQDFVPKEFVFIRRQGQEDIFISKAKEEMLTVKSISFEKDNNLSVHFVAICPDNPLVAGKESECTQSHTSSQCISPSTSDKQNTILSLGLKSPTSWSIRGVKVYDEKEIEVAIGKEKERRMFWNKRAKNLSKSSMTKVKIYETIHNEWRLEKSENLLRQSASTSDAVAIGQSSKETRERVKKGTLENNRQKVELFKAEFDTLSNDVKELGRKAKKSPEERERLKTLREKLALAKSNLRKAHDAMRKTLKKLSG